MWKEIWILMLVLAFISLAVAVLLTFIWDIVNIIDELSGRKAKRQIKMLHDLNSSTGTFDRLSTNEIYSGISSGTLLNEELSNIYEEKIKNFDNTDVYDSTSKEEGGNEEISYISDNDEDDEESTSYLNENEDSIEEVTSYLDDEEEYEESTSYLSDEDVEDVKDLTLKGIVEGTVIKVIEEQSSL